MSGGTTYCNIEQGGIPSSGNNVRKIAEYIQNQLKKDALSDQLTLNLSAPFTGGK